MTISGKAAVIAALLLTSGCAAAGTAASTNRQGRRGMDVGGNDVGAFHDNSGNRAFLRRHEPQEKPCSPFWRRQPRYLLLR